MVTITVDDNPKIITPIIKMLKKIDPSGTHLSAESGGEALELLKRNFADVAFLDIEMPELNGLETAKRIKTLCPRTNIVFITGYSEYALAAFGLYASGYLLKPVTENQIREALDNLSYPNAPPMARKIKVRCFGQFEVWYNGEPIKFTRSLTKTLFAYLIDRRGAMCDTDQMICAVWPEGVVNQTYSSYLRMLLAATIAALLLGMVTPVMTKVLTSNVTQFGDTRLLTVILVILLLVTAAAFLVTAMKQLLLARISSKVAIPLQAAFMMRLLSAPTGELKAFSAGDLGTRIGSLYGSLKTLMNMFLSIMLTAACSLICIPQMIYYAPAPALIAIAVTVVLVILYVFVIRLRSAVSENRMTYHAEESGLTYALIDGMQKIILSGAEKRAFSVWARVYRNSIRSIYDPPLLLKVFGVLTPAVLLLGTMGIYPVAVRTAVPPSAFYAFLSSYAILTGALTMISASAVNFADALPIFRMLRPVMDFAPEIDGKKEVVQRLRGNISLQNVTFRYSERLPPVLENLNIEIRRGEYVGIVGTTGSGKSTIFRLLLGFEKPDHGEILYDGKKLSSLDVTSLRRKIGTVLQNGEVFQGTILSNITVSGTNLSEDDAWGAAEIAGIADDIRRMPMKMNTPLPDSGRGISGGQKQRLLIARAVATKPSVLFFDEATSALDNVTQKAVSDAIGEMDCTRVVIAHRLSTVQNCDRILCLDQGHIVEEGTYEELMQKDGFSQNL